MRDGACQRHEILIARLRSSGAARHGDGRRDEDAEGEREQEEAFRGHWATSVPDGAPNDNSSGSLDDVASGRRLIILVVALALVGAPAIALRAFCVGESCAQEGGGTAAVPFCPLPADLRAHIEAGYRQGRSPDVMAATRDDQVVTDAGGVRVSWPSASVQDTRVPIVFWGVGVNAGGLPDGTGLDQIAPTLESILGFSRPHPQVRAGVAVDGVASDDRPRLVIMIAWEGAGSAGLGAAPSARRLVADLMQRGAGTLDGTTGALPLDPTAGLTTIGTGALPSQHGITATLVRNDRGDVGPAWAEGAPLSVVSTLAEDFDRGFDERPRIGLIAGRPTDRGLIGGSWYPEHDQDQFRIGEDPLSSLRAMISTGFGSDDVTDIVGVALAGPLADVSRTTRALVSRVMHANIPTTFVIAGTGQASRRPPTTSIADDVDAAIGAPVVAATVPGGLFLDQSIMAANDVTSDDVVRAMDAMKAEDGSPVFADAYPGFAISFSRYC